MFKLVILSFILLHSVAEAQLQIWEHHPTYKNGGKKSYVFQSTNLESSWDNRVSYVKAIRGDYVLYSGKNFQGDSVVVQEGDDDSIISQWNDKLSSVRYMGSGCIKKDIDYAGNDIKSINNVLSIDICIDLCRNYQGCEDCKSVAYNNRDQRCWLKHTTNGWKVNLKFGVDSANVDCETLDTNNRINECVHKDYDFHGADLGHLAGVVNIYDCVDHCEEDERCKGIAYIASTKTCYPKYKRLGDTPRRMEGCYSVEMECLYSC